jgi:hypothetical protein
MTLTVGPRNAYTSQRGLRYYQWKGVDYPSVTTIRRMAGLPFNLSEWQISKVIERAIDGYQDLGKIIGKGDNPDTIKAAKKWLRSASMEERDAAALLGTRVHDAATSQRDLTKVSADLAPYLRQFYDWLHRSKARIITVERQVWNLTVGYAGTFDMLIEFPDGRIFVVDLKTGKGTWAEHALQAIGYAMAEFVGEDDVRDEPVTQNLRDAAGIALLHLSKVGWAWQQITVTPKLWKAFLGLHTFALFAEEHPTIDTLLTNKISGAAPMVSP